MNGVKRVCYTFLNRFVRLLYKHKLFIMWHVRSMALTPFKSRVASSYSVSYTDSTPWHWQIFYRGKQNLKFSSKPCGRSQIQDQTQVPLVPRFNQGDEAMKITRIGMYVNIAMAATKVGRTVHYDRQCAGDAAES